MHDNIRLQIYEIHILALRLTLTIYNAKKLTVKSRI